MTDKYRLLVCTEDTGFRWEEACDGPFDTIDEAIDFAHAECGSTWIVVDPCDAPIAFGDWRGVQGQLDEAMKAEIAK